MEKQINWTWKLDYNSANSKWMASFNAYNYPTIFNAETKEFTDHKTAFLWFETKKAEFERGIDAYTSNLQKQNKLLMEMIVGGKVE